MIQDQQLRPPLRLDRGAAPRASALASTRERGDGPMRGRRRRGLTNSLEQQLETHNRHHNNSDSSAVVRSELPPAIRDPSRMGQLEADRGCGGLKQSRPAHTTLWMEWPYGEEFAPDKSASAIKGRADQAWRDRRPAKECVGSNRNEKNDRNFPLQRQSRRIPLRTKTLTHYQFHAKGETRTALPMRNSLDRNHSHLTNSFRNGPPDRSGFATSVDPIAPRSLGKEDEMNGG